MDDIILDRPYGRIIIREDDEYLCPDKCIELNEGWFMFGPTFSSEGPDGTETKYWKNEFICLSDRYSYVLKGKLNFPDLEYYVDSLAEFCDRCRYSCECPLVHDYVVIKKSDVFEFMYRLFKPSLDGVSLRRLKPLVRSETYAFNDIADCIRACLAYKKGWWIIWSEQNSKNAVGMKVFDSHEKAWFWNSNNVPHIINYSKDNEWWVEPYYFVESTIVEIK